MTTTERVFAIMAKNNVTQADLAKVLNCSKAVLTQWKHGDQNPSADALIKIADHFRISLDWLCGRTDAQNSEILPSQQEQSDNYKRLLKAVSEMDDGQIGKLRAYAEGLISDSDQEFSLPLNFLSKNNIQ